MDDFAPILPELILTIGGVVLMMVAAFTGRRGAGITSGWPLLSSFIARTLSWIRISPSSSASGRGGQPGTYTSTGTTRSTPLTTL